VICAAYTHKYKKKKKKKWIVEVEGLAQLAVRRGCEFAVEQGKPSCVAVEAAYLEFLCCVVFLL
jgi:hypothetical protein